MVYCCSSLMQSSENVYQCTSHLLTLPTKNSVTKNPGLYMPYCTINLEQLKNTNNEVAMKM